MEMQWATTWESIADAIPDLPAITNGTTTRTWAEYDDRSARVAAALHAAGLDGPAATTAHFAASIPPRFLLAGFLPGEMAAERIASGTPEPDGGRARVPTAPGLGIEVNEEALGQHLLRVE